MSVNLHLTSNLFAYVLNSDYGVYQHKSFHVDKNQVSLVCAQKQAPGLFIAYALYTALSNSCYLRRLSSFVIIRMGN